MRKRNRLSLVDLHRGRWAPLGRPLDVRGALPAVGELRDGQRTIDVQLVDATRGRRSVRSLSHRRWHESPSLSGHGIGPATGGPVRLHTRVYVPLVDAGAEPWRMSAYVLAGEGWSLAAGPLNRGPGNAQGVLRVAAGSVWAAWQQSEQMENGMFATRIYAQPVAPEVGPPRQVWTGDAIGPGTLEVVEGMGRR